MDYDFWHKQQKGKPLFPQLEWSRPENRQFAGKLLIIGGNLHGFAAPAEAYAESLKAGIGVSRVLLPNAIQKLVGPNIETGEFTDSTPSGSLSQAALSDIIEWGTWADGVLFAGDMGRNSETAIVVERFLQQSEKLTTLTKDSIDYVTAAPQVALERPNTALVLSLSQLQRLATAAKFATPITFGMDLLHLVHWLNAFTQQFAPYIIVKHHDYILVSANGEVSTTKLASDLPVWRLRAATQLIVWWIQNRHQPFEAITGAIFHLIDTPKNT